MAVYRPPDRSPRTTRIDDRQRARLRRDRRGTASRSRRCARRDDRGESGGPRFGDRASAQLALAFSARHAARRAAAARCGRAAGGDRRALAGSATAGTRQAKRRAKRPAIPTLRIPLMAAVSILEQGGNERPQRRRRSPSCAASWACRSRNQSTATPGRRRRCHWCACRGSRSKTFPTMHSCSSIAERLLVGADAAIARIRREAVRRPSLADRIPPADAYRRMIAAEADLDRALALIDEARQLSDRPGESTAGLGPCRAAAAHRQRQRPAISGSAGADRARAHGRPAGGAGAVPHAVRSRHDSRRKGCRWSRRWTRKLPAVVGTAPEPGGGRIWTPDSERPAGKKSSLWTPS